QPEPEYFCFKCLPTILKVDSSCRLKEFVSGQKDVVLKWVKLLFDRPEFDDEFISTILKLIKAYPSNEILIAEITNYLKKNQEVAPNRKVRLLFYVVERKFDLLIDLMEEELGLSSEEFWNQVLNSWEATGDKTEDRLLDKIRKRIQQLNQQKQQVEVPPALEVREETTMFRRKAKH
uniref:Uncharacterized protein n=1 Tax=Panagrolaimus sp. JU765 TaxID=591449 RepID=A0AC34RF38_9BILA